MKLYLSLCAKRELSPWPVVSCLRQWRQQAHACARSCRRSHGCACPRGLAAWGPGGRLGLVSGGLAYGKDSFGGLDLGSDGGSLLRLTPLGLNVRILYGCMLSCGPAPLCAEKQGLNNYAGINGYRIVRR